MSFQNQNITEPLNS